MRFYETVFVARQEITSNQVETLTQHYTSLIQSFGGEVSKTEFCGLRTLAYPIKKNKKVGVAHKDFLELDLALLQKQISVLYDVKGILGTEVDGRL